jgi:urea carboxylase-associated protein 1
MGNAMTVEATAGLEKVIYDFVVPARQPWSRVIHAGEILRIVDLEGQQAVDFLCYSAEDPGDRYSAMNTIKVQGNAYVGKGTVLYSDAGIALFTLIADTLGRHDTIYGCCSNPNNFLRYGVKTTESCYSNFLKELSKYGLGREAIAGNVNFFMQVPVLADGGAGIADGVSPPGGYVDLRAETDVLAVLSNCPQMHNPCNGYNPTPIRVVVRRA